MTEEEAKIVNCRARREFLDALRYKQTRQGSFEESFLHFDHPLFAGGPMLDPSDHGESALAIRSSSDETPLWRMLWRRARSKLTRKQKRILDALLVDFRTTEAARVAGVSEPSIRAFKKTFFKTHFNQCHKAWKCNFA